VGTAFFVCLLFKRLIERWFIKLYRQAGRNSRTVTLIGNDPELMSVYDKLAMDDTQGYKVLGYYADEEMGKWTHSLKSDGGRLTDGVSTNANHTEEEHKTEKDGPKWLGTLQDFLKMMKECPEKLELGDEMYVSLSRRDRDIIKKISRFCDHKVIRFYYIPVSVESIGLNLKREFLDDIEIYATYDKHAY
jgi:putative colanic acid biosynthesis UDP-glucose lipid carrier transferase